MITEDYVSFDTAKLLKEKGFVVPYDSFRGVFINGEFLRRNPGQGYYYNIGDEIIEVCSIQMAMKWLREVHKIHISVEMGFDVDNNQYYFFAPSVCRFSSKSGEYKNPFGEMEFNTYEEAAEATIKYCLENLI